VATTDRLLGVSGGISFKAPCVVASTGGNLTLSSSQTIDGIVVGASERVLIKDQTDTTENGIYVATGSTWDRAKDFDGNEDVVPGTLVYVDRGTTNGASIWAVNSSSTHTTVPVGSTNITLSQIV